MRADRSVSLVVPAFNEERLIGQTLHQIEQARRAFSEAGWESEVIVCNNNSTDRTAELAEAAGARVVFEPVNQIGRARNTGASVARGEWLLFVDADSQVSFELFQDTQQAMASRRYVAGGSTLKMDEHFFMAALSVRLWNAISRIRRWLAGSYIFCLRSVFEEAGGFDTRWFVGEELDLSERLKQIARQRQSRVVILHRHPLVTSARKMRLYSLREHLGFLLHSARTRGKAMQSRDACFTWYDGRR